MLLEVDNLKTSFYTDEGLQLVLGKVFHIHSFKCIELEGDDSELHFQAFILRKR